MKTYSELCLRQTYEGRLRYLADSIQHDVGDMTFNGKRTLNQLFYKSQEWRSLRDFIIVRDMGCDMALAGNEITGTIYVHHIEPLQPSDFLDQTSRLTDPENLVCVSRRTHDAIHYGFSEDYFQEPLIERRRGDTLLWPSLKS